MKIGIVGAGYAGLMFASLMQHEHEIMVFERLSYEERKEHHAWSDSIDLSILDLLEIERPEKIKNRFIGKQVKKERKGLFEPLKKEGSPLIVVDRRELWKILYARCEKVDFVWNVRSIELNGKIDRAYGKNEVAGMIVDGERLDFDLVVDASGFASVLRRQFKTPVLSRPFPACSWMSSY